MQYRKLGKTENYVSVIGFGCWPIVGGFNWGKQDERDSLAALRSAYEEGVSFYDTAEGYGNGYSEQLIGKSLGQHRHEIVIASKVSKGNLRPEDTRHACEMSLRNLNTDYIDVYQIHWPNPDIPLDETLACMGELQKEGKIRYIGVSNFGVASLKQCVREGIEVVSNQIAYNLLFRAAEFEIIPFCHEHGISILPYCPIMQGLLTGKFNTPDDVPEDRARTRHFSGDRPQARHGEAGAEHETFQVIDELRGIAEETGISMATLAQKWLLAQPDIPSVLTGARNPEQVKRNVQVASTELPEEIRDRLSSVTEPLKQRLGRNPDLWESNCRVM